MADGDRTALIEFRDIPECEGYTFCSDGSVWSFWGRGYKSQRDVCFQLKPRRHKSGHLQVRVKLNGKMTMCGVHTLICWAFHGPCPLGMEACHKDGIPDHNTPDNLYWGTRLENVADQFAHGVFARGERHGAASFTEDEIREIRRLHTSGLSCAQIAREKNRSRNTIKGIVTGHTWRHVS